MELQKYKLEVIGIQILSLPAKSKLLSIQTIDNAPWLIVLGNPEADKINRTIKTYEIGETIKSAGKYVGTYVQVGGGTFIYTAFDEGE